ncbi:hypothetical protein FSP39_002105 [Pinctada imbricata]|uniref:G-protein coupled receptors family 1 profile domain-containing protein n=1 Tax=Pinctada imbricata TaxID=66713 RepID=A0AA88YGB8_PINIB|nr:hypothetical protein FSP39_002105 [Pinctada imbricata]
MTKICQLAIALLFAIMQAVILIESAVVFFFILCRKSLRTVPNFYIASLSVSDFLVGAFFATSAIIAALEVDVSGGWCRFIITMELWSYTAGSVSLLALAIDRYRATCRALRYRPTPFSTVCIIALVWFGACLYCLRNVIRFEIDDENNETSHISPVWCNTFLGKQTLDLHFRVLDFFVVFLTPGILMSVLYFKVYFQLKTAFVIAPTSSFMRKRKTVKMLILQVCVFFVSWLPVYLHDIVREIQILTSTSTDEIKTSVGVEYMEVTFVLAHSIINPIIYAYYNTNFSRELTLVRRSLKRYFFRKNDIHPISMDPSTKTTKETVC